MELDASAAKSQQQPLLSPVKSPSPRDEIRKAKEVSTEHMFYQAFKSG